MAEFYVTFDWRGLLYLAFVLAPECPARSHFASYEDLHAAMDGLGHFWQLQCEMPHPGEYAIEESIVWEKQLVGVKSLTLARPIVSMPGGLYYG
jgi:hypothetical protein